MNSKLKTVSSLLQEYGGEQDPQKKKNDIRDGIFNLIFEVIKEESAEAQAKTASADITIKETEQGMTVGTVVNSAHVLSTYAKDAIYKLMFLHTAQAVAAMGHTTGADPIADVAARMRSNVENAVQVCALRAFKSISEDPDVAHKMASFILNKDKSILDSLVYVEPKQKAEHHE